MESGKPLVFAEKPMKTGKGDKAYKSLTAAVKAAEKARDEVRQMQAETMDYVAKRLQVLRELNEKALRSNVRTMGWTMAAAGVSLVSVFLLVFI